MLGDRDDRPLLAVRRLDDDVGGTASWRADRAYWRWMNSIIPTSSGIRITTTSAPPENFSLTTMSRTIAGQDVPKALMASATASPGPGSRTSGGPCPTGRA